MALPDGLTAQSEVDMELQPKDADWTPQTIGGVQVSNLKQVSTAGVALELNHQLNHCSYFSPEMWTRMVSSLEL